MVNVEKFAERLKIVMDYYELSAALFAEKIEVQRSSISHILSKRNKPSLEFVLKVLHVFPEVDLFWLLNGDGKFPKENKGSTPTPSSQTNIKDQDWKTQMVKNDVFDQDAEKIDRIVVFYSDGTFKNYIP
jgi:transcriptional regulator with XRE-family HTH domain